MLDRKPVLPDNINHKTVALRLFFRDSLIRQANNKIVEYEEIITREQLYSKGSVILECGLHVRAPVKICYIKGMLTIKTAGAVDVHISGDIPARAIHVETTGDCVFFNGRFLSPDLKIYVTAKVIAIDIPVINAKLITLLNKVKTNNAIWVRKSITTSGLIVDASKLKLDTNLQADKVLIKCNQMSVTSYAELTVTGQQYNSSGYPDYFDRTNVAQIASLNKLNNSEITITDEFIYSGTLKLNKCKFSCVAPIKLMPDSKVDLNLVELAAKSLDVSENASVSGNNVILQFLQDAQIDGSVVIDNLRLTAENVDVSRNGVLDGVSKLIIAQRKYLTSSGKVRSLDTYIDGELTIARFGGMISGAKCLNINGKLSAALFGGCLSGERILDRTGLSIHLFGIVSGWCSSLDSLVGLEFGNLYLPYIDFTTSAHELYNTACDNLKKMKSLSSTTSTNIYNELYNLAPKTTDEAWQVLASKYGVIRAVLSTISIPVSTIFSFSYQTVALIKQLIRVNNMHDWSSLTRFTNQSSKEMLMLLLDLKGLIVSGNALHKNAIGGFNSTLNTRVAPTEALTSLTSLYMPVVQNDTLFDASAPMLSVSWTETRQNWFSVRGGYLASWNQYEQTMFDQHDYSSRVVHNAAFSCGGTRYHNGVTKYYSTMSIAAKNYEPSPTSLMESAGNNTQYSLTADNANLVAPEKHKIASYAIKNQPISDAEDLLNGKGKFTEIEVSESISVSTQSQGNAVIVESERGPNVARSLTIPGDITIPEIVSGAGLTLNSTQGSIHQQKDIVVQNDLSLEAAKEIIKPGVIAQSIDGNVSVIAGGAANNNNGGQVLAHNGHAVLIGAKVENRTNGASQQSIITSRNTFVSSTKTELDLLNSTIRGTETARIETAGDFNLQPEVSRQWLSAHEMGNVYKGSLIQGGTGIAENGWVGAEIIVHGRFNGAASSVQSVGKIIVYARKDFYAETKATVFLAEDRDEKHGWFNKIYYKSEDVNFSEMTFVSGDKIKFICEDGQVNLLGVKHFAPNGTEVWARKQVNTDPVTATLHKSKTKVKVKVFEKETESTDGVETVPVFAHTTGITSFTSLEEGITHKNTLYIGDKGSQFQFTAPKDISTTLNTLNHRILETNVSLKLAAFGQNLIGSDNHLSMNNMLNALDPTGGSALDFMRSSNIPEAIVNGANTMLGISNTLESIMENGLKGAISKQLGASVTLYRSKKNFEYQAEGQGGFYGGAKICMVSNDGNVVIGINIYDMSDLNVKAKTLSLINKALNSKFSSKSISVTPSVNLAGEYDISVAYQADSGFSTTQMQHYMFIGKLHLDVERMHIRGTLVLCEDVTGRAKIIETEDVKNCSISKHESYSASAQGNVGFYNQRTVNESHGATGQLQVANDINNLDEHLKCEEHINHGGVGILTTDPTTNKLKVKFEQRDQSVQSKISGGGLTTNISKNGIQSSRVSINFLNKHDAVTQDGLKQLSSTKFKASSFMPAMRMMTNIEPTLNSSITEHHNDEVLQTVSSDVVLTPTHNIDQSNILDEQFLAKPGFVYAQPEEPKDVTSVNKDSQKPNAIPTKANSQVSDSVVDDWTGSDSYSEEHIRRSIDDFVRNPINRAAARASNDESIRGATFTLPSALPASSDNTTLTYLYAMGRGIEQGRDSITNAVIHPIETAEGLGLTVWDGLNIISEVTLGITTPESRLRNQQRGSLVNETIQKLKNGDGVLRTEMASKFVTECILGSAVTRPIGPIAAMTTDTIAGQYLLTQYCIKRSPKFISNGQANIEQAIMLNRRYAIEEIFTPDGKLTQSALSRVEESIQDVSKYHHDSPVYKLLVNRGNINEWGKHKIKIDTDLQLQMNDNIYPLKGQVHFYMNSATKEVFYGRDFKIKLDAPGNPVVKIDDIINQTLKVRGKYDCKM